MELCRFYARYVINESATYCLYHEAYSFLNASLAFQEISICIHRSVTLWILSGITKYLVVNLPSSKHRWLFEHFIVIAILPSVTAFYWRPYKDGERILIVDIRNNIKYVFEITIYVEFCTVLMKVIFWWRIDILNFILRG